MTAMRFDQLLPGPGEVEFDELVASLQWADRAPVDRPLVVANFVSSVDGHASFQGQTAQLGDDGDLEVFRTLRREVDAVLVGTGTLRVERYGRILKLPESRARRRERGLAGEPLACIVTRHGDVPLDIPLFAEPEARVVIFTSAGIDTTSAAAEVRVVEWPEAELSFAAALRWLRAEQGVRTLLCEGGPSVLHALIAERVLDELFLTLAPDLTGGGDGPALTNGPELEALHPLTLSGVLHRRGSLYLRYKVDRLS